MKWTDEKHEMHMRKYEAIAAVQNAGGICAVIDFARETSPDLIAQAGANLHDLYISLPDTVQQGAEIAAALASSQAIDLIVFLAPDDANEEEGILGGQ